MSIFFYRSFLLLYKAGFAVAALFNSKARKGFYGRKHIISTITNQLNNNYRPTTWMHCASLGEFEQGRPVLEDLRKKFPNQRIILTFFSASGYEVMKNYSGADHVFYLPFDHPAHSKKVVQLFNPSLVLWVKYEYWFYYLQAIHQQQIPLLLISGIMRPDQPFFKWYGGLWKKMLGFFTHFFLQNQASAELLKSIDFVNNITITGDTRFDRVIDIAEKFVPVPGIADFCGSHQVIVAGSTWEDDEAELIHFVKANPAIKCIIAPHEITHENMQDVLQEFPKAVFYSKLAEELEQGIDHQVLIIDNVGMLSRLYYYADIAYVGGGFGADGVHNVLEAAVYGKPVVYGPSYEKFAEAVELIEAGGGISIENAVELEKELTALFTNENVRTAAGNAAKAYVYAHRGASKKVMEFIQEKRLLTN